MHRATNPTHRAYSMCRASVFAALWRMAQCAAPALCAVPTTQCATPVKLEPFVAIFSPRLCSKFHFLFWMQMSSLNTRNGFYTKNFDFSLIEPTNAIFPCHEISFD